MLVNDIYESIILYAKINDVQMLCSTDKNMVQFCNNRKIWMNKFQMDQLPIVTMQTNGLGWINEYKKVKKAKFMTDHTFELLKKEMIDFEPIIINFKTEDIISLLLKHL